jgi:adenylate cyclase
VEKKMIVREFDPEEIPVVESFFFGDMTGTVMFLDIENSLRISASLLPRGTYEFLKKVLLPVIKCVEDHYGFIVQIQGDGVIAVFGHDKQSCSRHAELAVNCAIEAQKLIRGLDPIEIKGREFPLAARIGICSGNMFATMMEYFGKYEYNIMGLTVNLASRLQKKCANYKTNILVDNATNAYIHEEILTRKIGAVTINGNPGLMTIYEVMARYGEHTKEDLRRKRHYEEGLDYYKRKAWPEALRSFLQVGEDKASYEMIKRCKKRLSALSRNTGPLNKNK